MKLFKKIIIPCILLLLGLLIYTYPMLLDFNNMPGDMGDARFINYILEHGFKWLKQIPPHQEFWSPPEFYPLKNSLAFSDIMLGGMLIYCPIRFICDNPQTCLQIFFIIINILNFAIFLFFVKRIFKLNIFYSSIAAYFFAFCLPKYAQIEHMQLFMQFLMILPLWLLCEIKKENSDKKNLVLFSFACLSFALLTYTTYCFAWYLSFGILLGILIATIFKKNRVDILEYFKLYKITFIFPFLITFALLAYLAYRYLSVNYLFIEYYFAHFANILTSHSFFDNVLLGFFSSEVKENNIGIGIIATILFIFGMFKNKYKKEILIFVIAIFIIFTNHQILTWLIENFLPFKTIRACSRFIFILLPVYAIVIAYFFKSLKSKTILITLFILFMLEQIPYYKTYNWTKTQHRKSIEKIIVPDECKIMNIKQNRYDTYTNVANNIDAMFWASENNKQTCNGYGIFVGNPNCKINPICEIEK